MIIKRDMIERAYQMNRGWSGNIADVYYSSKEHRSIFFDLRSIVMMDQYQQVNDEINDEKGPISN